jgi:thiol-disulfide isomerase/thioredoxin
MTVVAKTSKPASRRPTPAKQSKQFKQSNTGMIVVVALAVVAVIAIVAAVVMTQVGKDDGAAGLEQTQPVTVTGQPLPTYDDKAASDSAVGLAAPALKGSSFDGSAVDITPGGGQPKVLVFLAHWCPHCQAEVPRIVQWQQEGKVPAGVDLSGIATGTTDTRPNYPPSSWLEDEGWTYPTLADSPTYQASEAYGLANYPFFVAVNGEGNVVGRVSGELTEEQFIAFVNLAAQG